MAIYLYPSHIRYTLLKTARSNEPRREKTGFLHICENKDADQLRGNREADQRLCFHYTVSTIHLLPKSLAIFCGSTARFVSDMVRNLEDRFSHNKAQIDVAKPCRSASHIVSRLN